MKKINTNTFDGKQKSLVMRKSAFCNCATDQRLCFRYMDCTILLYINRIVKPSAIFCGCTARFVSDLVGNPEDRFSYNEAQIPVAYFFNDMRP